MYEVAKISISTMIILFGMYILGHGLFLYMNENSGDDYEHKKFVAFMAKWFPAVYVIFLLIYFSMI